MYDNTARLEMTAEGIRDMDTGKLEIRFRKDDDESTRWDLFTRLCNKRNDERDPEGAEWRRQSKIASFRAF